MHHKGQKRVRQNTGVSRMVERLGESEVLQSKELGFSSEFSNKSLFVGKL